MARVRRITDTTVRADIRPAGDFGGCSMSGFTRTEAEAKRLAEDLAARIRQHCADLLPTMSRHRGVSVVHEYEYVCSHCGEPWGAASEHGNPECCPAAWADEAKSALEEVGDGLRLIRDGDQYALVGPHFVDLHQSEVIAWIPASQAGASEAEDA